MALSLLVLVRLVRPFMGLVVVGAGTPVWIVGSVGWIHRGFMEQGVVDGASAFVVKFFVGGEELFFLRISC